MGLFERQHPKEPLRKYAWELTHRASEHMGNGRIAAAEHLYAAALDASQASPKTQYWIRLNRAESYLHSDDPNGAIIAGIIAGGIREGVRQAEMEAAHKTKIVEATNGLMSVIFQAQKTKMEWPLLTDVYGPEDLAFIEEFKAAEAETLEIVEEPTEEIPTPQLKVIKAGQETLAIFHEQDGNILEAQPEAGTA